MKSVLVIAALLAVGLWAYSVYPAETRAAACAIPGVTCAEPHHDVSYYLTHRAEREAKVKAGMAEYVNDPGKAATDIDPNFTNALTAVGEAQVAKDLRK